MYIVLETLAQQNERPSQYDSTIPNKYPCLCASTDDEEEKMLLSILKT